MSAMRRTIAIALAAALLFAGGCGRQDRKDRRDQRPATVSTQTTPAQDASAAIGGGSGGGEDADRLLDQVDQQLSGDAQPAGDED
jgi:hypothetical protein